MSTASIAYGTATAITMTLTSLASSSTLLAGREGTAIDNTSSKAIDYILGGKVATGVGTPIAGQIEVWAYGSYDGTTYSGGATGSDAALTFTSQEKTTLQLIAVLMTDTTASHVYEFGPRALASGFGGAMPIKFGAYVTHNSSSVLSATASNHEIKYTAINYTIA